MCNPAAALALQATGVGMDAVGAYGQAAGQKSLLSYEANLADINAGLAERAAKTELLRGQFEEQKARLAAAQAKSSARVSMAAGNIDLGEGSALNALTSHDVIGEIDANTIKANAVRSAWGYRVQATNYGNEALMKRANASAISPGMAASSSLLGGAGQVAGSWYSTSKAGAFTGNGTGRAVRAALSVGDGG